MAKKIILSTLAVFFFLMLVNAVLFPVFFPDGPLEKFLNTRVSPLLEVHTLAILAAALFLSLMFALSFRGNATWKQGLQYGILAALLATFPSNLHVFASAEFPLAKVFASTPWVLFTWGSAGAIIGVIQRKRSLSTSS